MTLDTRIEDLGLSVRAKNGLTFNNVETLGELITCSEAELMRTPNLGRVTLAEVKAKLEELGLRLGTDYLSSSDLNWDY